MSDKKFMCGTDEIKYARELTLKEVQRIRDQYNTDERYERYHLALGCCHVRQAHYLAEGNLNKMYDILDLLATHEISFDFIDQSYKLKQVLDGD